MQSKGREVAKLSPSELDEMAKLGAVERPLSSDEATGHVTPKRLQREVAVSAWQYIVDHASSSEPLPDWIIEYLRNVGSKVVDNLSDEGALSREDADAALGITGKGWPKHSPVSVYLTMQEWIEEDTLPNITGPTSAAKHYIEKLMPGDSSTSGDTIIRKFKAGRTTWQSDE